MSTRIDFVSFIHPDRATLSIDPQDAKRLIDKYEDNFPEYCFLRDVEDKIGQVTKEKVKCQCGTQSYGNAKFCRECGTRIVRKQLDGVALSNVDWHDDEYATDAANTFFPVFVEKVVPALRGHAECSVTFSDEDDEDSSRTAHFVISNGELTWCEVQLRPGADAPKFEAEYPYEESEDEDDDDDR